MHGLRLSKQLQLEFLSVLHMLRIVSKPVQLQEPYFGHSPMLWLLSSQLIAIFFATRHRQEQ